MGDHANGPVEHADTVPGFTMQSETFYLKFVTGMQCGVSSKLLEYETDWYEVMEILLSRLQDEPESQPNFERIAGRDLEYWASVQPGGDTLNLKIKVRLEEKRYFLPPMGMRKTLKLTFNDRFTTQVLFHVKKKQMLRSLKYLSAVVVAASLAREEGAEVLGKTYQIPRCLVPWVRKAWHNCWTARYFKAKLPGCPDFCACKQSRVERKNKEVKERKTRNSQKSQGDMEMEAKSRVHSKVPVKAKGTPANAQKNKKQAPVKGAAVKAKVSTSDKKREDRIEKLNNKVKCLEKEMLNRFEVTKKSLEDDKDTPKRMSIGNKKENEFAKLQHKYKVMQTKYKALKKEQVVKNNLQNLQQKYKALEAKFKNLKQKDKTESDSGECKETPAKRMKKDGGKLSREMYPKLRKPIKAPKVSSQEPKSSKALKKSSPLFKCEQCQLDFSLISKLRKHMKTGCKEDKSIPEPASKRRRRG